MMQFGGRLMGPKNRVLDEVSDGLKQLNSLCVGFLSVL